MKNSRARAVHGLWPNNRLANLCLMHKYVKIILLLFLATYAELAQPQTNLVVFPQDIFNPPNLESPPTAIPAIRISPAEVVTGSVQEFALQGESGGHQLLVRWTYTEAGAKRMLAFWEAHDRQKVRTDIGSYEFSGIVDAHSLPPGCTNYSQWREGWLKHRTDKVFDVSEDDAKKIIAGLQGQ